MEEPKGILEQISTAALSSHLEHKPYTCSIDKIGALGMAGVSNALSSAVFRLKYGNEARFYSDALRALTKESKRLSRKHGWTGSMAQFAAMNRAVLDYWLDESCNVCDGLGYEKIVGAPSLSTKPCGVCRGTTRRPLPKLATKQWKERFIMLLALLESMEYEAGNAVIARLARTVVNFPED